MGGAIISRTHSEPKTIELLCYFQRFNTSINPPTSLLEKLSNLGCDINFIDFTRDDVLHRLAFEDCSSGLYLRAVELLLEERGGDILEARDEFGGTPLETAVLLMNLDLLRLLLRRGASMILSDNLNVAQYSFEKKRFSCLHAIIKFCLVKKLQGKVVDESVINFIELRMVERHYKLCWKQIIALKMHKIDNTNLSIHFFLFKPLRVVAKYMKNEDVLMGTQSKIIGLSEYHYDIVEVRKEAIIRRNLEDDASNTFKNVFGLPGACSEVIISYLENKDLRNFSDTWKL
ncbi:uncharacterized protein LOC123671658 [Harmonia axyridis]|uniref:uncharacterized protein LOC123671658 n=1 Tax=Harmonia axyridis TaxID=115357 RepID=UPI001E275971|nr:uncharacterized protein LOC123671658 [Harmonia axyridis]